MCGLAPSNILGALRYVAGGWDAAEIECRPFGKVVVRTGTSPHGQGHETTWSQIVADGLGVSPDDVEVLHGDTSVDAARHGHVRLALGRGRRRGAPPRRREGEGEGAHDRGARARGGRGRPRVDRRRVPGEGRARQGADDPRPRDLGVARARAPRRASSRCSRARRSSTRRTSRGPPARTSASSRSTPRRARRDILRYVAVDDCGTVINPMIVDGQVHGGVAQGIAEALYEEAVYDEPGNLMTSSMTQYLVPSAIEIPPMELDRTETPSTTNALGVKGIGEAGTIASPPAVVNAVVDAVSHLGVTELGKPASPERVWRAIQDARKEVAHDPGAVRLRARRVRSTTRSRRWGRARTRSCSPAGTRCCRRCAPRRAARRRSSTSGGSRICRTSARTATASRSARSRGITTWRPARRCSELCPIVAYAAGQIGDPQVRHMGTIGGSVAHGDPAGDMPSVLLALGRRRSWRAGPSGERTIAADDVLHVAVPDRARARRGADRDPRPEDGRRLGYLKFNRRAQDWALVGVAAVRSNGGAHVGLTNMGLTPLRATGVEEALDGGADPATRRGAGRRGHGAAVRRVRLGGVPPRAREGARAARARRGDGLTGDDPYGEAALAVHRGEEGVTFVVERDDGWIAVEAMGHYFAPHRRWIAVRTRDRRGGRAVASWTRAPASVAWPCTCRTAATTCSRSTPRRARSASAGSSACAAPRCGRCRRSARRTDRSTPSRSSGTTSGCSAIDRHGAWLLRRSAAPRRLTPGSSGSIRDPYRDGRSDALAYQARNRERGRMAGQMRFRLRYRSHRSAWFDYLAMSLPELTAIADAGGWEVDRGRRRRRRATAWC